VPLVSRDGYPDAVSLPVALGLPTVRRPAAPGGGESAHGSALPADRPADPRLVDRFGRVATDLRVSVTDRCSLRCAYCMPAEGLDWLPREHLLTDQEVIRLIAVAVERLGIQEVRFTGGEPLLRRGLEKIVAATNGMRTATGESPETALTTNGVGLDRRAGPLAEAGLRRVNVSIDSLDRETFARITHRDRLPDVLAGVRAATDAGLAPVKLNAVLLRGVNDGEAVALVRFALAHGYELRFIEQMPLDPQGAWSRTEMITAAEILDALSAELTLTPADPSTRGAAPAETWLVEDGERRGRIGIVASVTRPFCGDCDRTRLTADGQVRNCLFASRETDLRELLRSGASDEEIAQAWRGDMWAKRPGHGIDDPAFLRPARPMSAIGG
jgi:cyclic pyranopterin phosphate synthase